MFCPHKKDDPNSIERYEICEEDTLELLYVRIIKNNKDT